MGESTTLSATSGTHGNSLAETTGTSGGVLASGTYNFRYAYPGDTTACHHEASIGAGVSPSSGDITPVSRTIANLGSVAGTGEACWSVTGSMNNSQIAADAAITVN